MSAPAKPAWFTDPHMSALEKALRWQLRPLDPWLADRGITDIHINGPVHPGGPCPIFIKRGPNRERHEVGYSYNDLVNIGRATAAMARRYIDEDQPLVSGAFPDRQRVYLIRPPAVPAYRYAISIRRGASRSPTPDDLEASGVFEETAASEHVRQRPIIAKILELKAARKWRECIHTAYANALNVVHCGTVGTGKTHVMRAFFHSIPADRRVFTVQDIEELLDMPQENTVHTLYSPDGQGVSRHTPENLIEASLRCDMDELVNAEVRDGAAWALLRAALSGHAIKTSCHAGSADGAFDAIGFMVKQHPAGRAVDSQDLQQALRALIDMVVFHEVVDGKRRITQIHFQPDNRTMPDNIARALSGA